VRKDSRGRIVTQHHHLSKRGACAVLLAIACSQALATTPPIATPPVPPASAASAPKPAAAPVALPAQASTPAAVTSPVKASKPAPTVLGEEPLAPGEFAWLPQMSTGGPMLVLVNIKAQTAYVYRNGLRIGRTSVSTGKKGHETPTGVFTILQKNADHHSSIYNNAPMPYMQRLTWDGVALHAGNIPGYPASHGCVRLPYEFSKLLFDATTTGVTVVIANDTPTPSLVAGTLLKPRDTLSSQVEQAWNGAYTWEPELSTEGPLTIVMSTREKVAHVLRGGAEIGRVHVEINGPTPTGTTAYMLLDGTTGEESRIVPGKPALRWQVIGDSEQAERVTSAAESFAAGITVPPAFAAKVYPLLAPGATVVVTGESLSVDDSVTPLTVLRGDETGNIADATEDVAD
jgi:lipoprotein-anchoring transpeptidase ErfK/SrfK